MYPLTTLIKDTIQKSIAACDTQLCISYGRCYNDSFSPISRRVKLRTIITGDIDRTTKTSLLQNITTALSAVDYAQHSDDLIFSKVDIIDKGYSRLGNVIIFLVYFKRVRKSEGG